MWQVQNSDGIWRNVDAPAHWHNGRFYVDWPSETVRNVSFEMTAYAPKIVRWVPEPRPPLEQQAPTSAHVEEEVADAA